LVFARPVEAYGQAEADVIYGHTPVLEAEWLNSTLCIDTGCVFGNKMTALRWPERETVEVAAKEQYAEPARPMTDASGRTAQQDHDRLLYFDDFARKLRIETRLGGVVTIPEENSLAALEVASRFAVDPRWLIHLPPTMAAPPTAPEGPFLEHPAQAIEFFASRCVTDLVAEEKHMGSRALIIAARDPDAAAKRFGTEDGKAGVVYTRTGRAFFDDDDREAEVIARISKAVGKAGLWDELGTDWVLLDSEIMPWSAKAQELLQRQYYPTVAAARASAEALLSALDQGREIEGIDALRDGAKQHLANAQAMGKAIDGYCWEAPDISHLRIAPFHLLAAEDRVYSDAPHEWHMETLAKLTDHDPILQITGWKRFDPNDAAMARIVTDWWEDHTSHGGEGLVFKPNEFVVKGDKGLIQPAMKVRGRDYLRIIYGPDHDHPANRERLRKRGLGRKFSLADREFRLGLEGLSRFVEGKPLARVHECALGVLALESEPVDPRL
ncbi:MAG: polynucleotide kinase-phosphatase, partial [Pseudomonadota bacterium]